MGWKLIDRSTLEKDRVIHLQQFSLDSAGYLQWERIFWSQAVAVPVKLRPGLSGWGLHRRQTSLKSLIRPTSELSFPQHRDLDHIAVAGRNVPY